MTDNNQFTPEQWQRATEQARELGKRIAAAEENSGSAQEQPVPDDSKLKAAES